MKTLNWQFFFFFFSVPRGLRDLSGPNQGLNPGPESIES